MQLTKFRVLLMLILAVTGTALTVWNFTSAVPASTINSICEPGGCGSGFPFTFGAYVDSSNYLAVKGLGGGNAYKETSFSTLWNDMTTDSACSSGCSIFLHVGTFRPTTNMLLISNLKLFGEGSGSVIRANLLASTAKVSFPGAAGTAVGALFYGTGLSNVVFSDLALAGDDSPAASEDVTAQTYGPVCFGCTGITFKNVLFKDFNTAAMNLALDGSNNPSTNVTIINSVYQARTVAGVQYAGDGFGLEASQVLVTGNNMNCADDCIVIGTIQPGGQSSQTVNLQDFTLTGNFLQSKAHPIEFQAWNNKIFSNIAISTNTLLSSGSNAIGIHEANSVNPPSKNVHIAITGNILDGSTGTGSIAGVDVSNSYMVSITGNTFRKWGLFGIRLNYVNFPSSSGPATNMVDISSNVFDGANTSNGATGSFIYVDSNGATIYLVGIKNNQFQVAGNEKYFIDFNNANPGSTSELVDVQGNIFNGAPVTGLFKLPADANGYVIISASNSYSSTNPLGKLATPFGASSIGLQGTTAGPTASTTYTVRTANIFNFTSTGGTGVVLTIKDQAGNCIVCGASTVTGAFVPLFGTVNYGAFSVAPTEKIYLG